MHYVILDMEWDSAYHKVHKRFVNQILQIGAVKLDENFNIVDNALDMRDLQRWNGRALRNKENLSEHTHLVVACASELYDKLKSQIKINYENRCNYFFVKKYS